MFGRILEKVRAFGRPDRKIQPDRLMEGAEIQAERISLFVQWFAKICDNARAAMTQEFGFQ